MTSPIRPFETKFKVGERVNVDIFDVEVQDRQCTTGVIMHVWVEHPINIDRRKIMHTIEFENPYIKPECVLHRNILTINVETRYIERVS